VNLKPSPVKRSAIPLKEAKLKIFAKIGTSLTLKLLIINNELDTPFLLVEEKFILELKKLILMKLII
jgi:hypothetical protein